ncbi:10977_t:CDS:2 [Dentiscutata erythropus]|uniref:peptidylprolyl isomerase n=1 Tax=Dentiscutata erythropus TaxID=1348616 RepID=A0A9N9CZV4_9GLOM|nr:10977_t:CDS:2 [Dentiscutata erythropus]
MRLKAALVLEESEEDLRTTLFIETNNKKFVLCNLISGVHEQQNLNVTLLKGEDVKLYSVGHNKIHLTGNYIKIIDHDSESKPEEISSSITCKPNGDMNVKKMLNIDDESSESSSFESKDAIANTEDDSDEDLSEGDIFSDQVIIKKEIKDENGKHHKRTNDDNKDKQNVRAAKKQKTENVSNEPKSANVSIELKSADVSTEPKSADVSTEPKSADVKTETLTKNSLESEKLKTEDGNKNAEPRNKDLMDSDSKEKKESITTPEGVLIEDLSLGRGKMAKPGKQVQVRYIGKLLNGKVFDKNVSGKPFHFTLGKGEVIKGWEIGISGMRIGGERKLTIPPQQAYGNAGSPPG